MNLNELFFFKVFPCVKSTNNKINSNHKENKCYFYHVSTLYEKGEENIIEKDRRREPISFREFFKNLYNRINEEDNYTLPLDKIFDFKKENKDLNYYTDSLTFKEQKYNDYIYYESDYCLNETEFYYHINRYKKNICRFFKINGSCKKKFCFCKHITNWQKIENERNKDELESEKSKINGDDLDEGIITFNKKLSKWKEIKEIKFKEIIEIYNYVLSFENKYLSDFQKKEIKKYFSFFQQYYNENSLNNINNNYFNIIEKNSNPNEKIIREIQNQFNQNINSSNIYKDSNLLESLKISTNVCFFSKYDLIKLSEVIKFIYAMLNSSNGVIIYGGYEKDKSIKGISLKRKERDDFKRWFNTEFFKLLIQYERNIEYKFYDVANNNNDECILVIKVKQIKKNKLLTTSFSQKCFIINEKFLKQKSEEKNKILDENDVIELNTKEYLELLRKRLLVYYKKKFRLI